MNKWKSINGINVVEVYTSTLHRGDLSEPVSYIVEGLIKLNKELVKVELGYIIDVYSDEEALRCVYYREVADHG